MRKSRDFKAEYLRRIERGVARGLSRSQARGHARFGEAFTSSRAASSQSAKPLEVALKRMRGGESLSAAAKEARVSRERLSAYIRSHAGAAREGRAWTFNDQRRRTVEIFAAGHDRPQILDVTGYEPARLAGQHWEEAHRALADEDFQAAFVRRWEGLTIRDASGARHTLSTDLNEIYRAAHATERPFEQIYRLIT